MPYFNSISLFDDGNELVYLTHSGSELGINQQGLWNKFHTCVDAVSNSTTDANALISISKFDNGAGGSTLSFNYDNLIAKLGTYKTTSSFTPDIASYYTKTPTDSLLNAKATQSTTYSKTGVDGLLGAKQVQLR